MNQVVDVNTDGRPRRYSKHSDLMTLGVDSQTAGLGPTPLGDLAGKSLIVADYHTGG